ncbi:hypothetical protein FHL15_002804 [Xylaria flabelliformis]|uniref:Secreted protein n=1 Tax=Xylaria flabelliformis TaxID=2512241 RepID=A0A553I8M5_9PEZI|nr:hypothetical protein FHL15_002804 [Xylaria flabelliformis]
MTTAFPISLSYLALAFTLTTRYWGPSCKNTTNTAEYLKIKLARAKTASWINLPSRRRQSFEDTSWCGDSQKCCESYNENNRKVDFGVDASLWTIVGADTRFVDDFGRTATDEFSALSAERSSIRCRLRSNSLNSSRRLRVVPH